MPKMTTSPSLPQTTTTLRRQQSILFVLVLFVLAYKSNDALVNPQFWAEDAVVFFKDQFRKAFPQLFTPYAGYLHAVPRLVAWIAGWFPLSKAPLVYNAFALVLSALAITLTCGQLRRQIPVYVVALSFLLVPTNGEIFGNITNVQWFLQFALVALCLAPLNRDASKLTAWFRAGGVLIASLTGPFSILLSSVVIGLLIASLVSKKLAWDPFEGALSNFTAQRDWRVLSALGLGALVQLGFVGTHVQSGADNSYGLIKLLRITFTELVPIHTFGSTFLTSTLWVALYLAMLGVLLFSRRVDGRTRLLVLGFTAFATVEVFASIIRIVADLPLVYKMAGDRYFYVTKVVWWWAVWLTLYAAGMAATRSIATRATVALICFFALNNATSLRRPAFADFAWRDHVRQLDQPGPHTIPVNPGGPWNITVDGDPTMPR